MRLVQLFRCFSSVESIQQRPSDSACLFRIFSNVNAVSGFDYDRLTFRPFCSNADIVVVVVVVKMPIKTMQGHFT